MFYGQSIYLIERYALDIAKVLAESDDDVEKLYFDEYDFKDAKNKLLQSSLFANSNFLIKIDKNFKKELDSFDWKCNTNPSSRLIIACLGDADFKTMESSFSEKDKICFVRFFQPSDNEAINFFGIWSKKFGYEIWT